MSKSRHPVIVHTPFTRRRVLFSAAGVAGLFGALQLASRGASGPAAAPPLTPTPGLLAPLAIAVPSGGPYQDTNVVVRGAIEAALPAVAQSLGGTIGRSGRPALEIIDLAQPVGFQSQAIALAPLVGSGAPPDLVLFTGVDDGPAVPGALSFAATTHLTAPLDPGATPLLGALGAQMYAPALDVCRHKGALHALPLLALPTTLAYDRARFERAGLPLPPATNAAPAGWGWAAFLAAARRLTTAPRTSDAEDPDAGDFGVLPDACSGTLQSFIWQAGGDTWSSDGKAALLTDRPALDAAAFYAGLFRGGERVSPPALASSIEWGPEGIRNGRWWCGMGFFVAQGTRPAWQVAAEAPPEWPIVLAEPPRGRERASGLSVAATLSVSSKARDRATATVALAALAEHVTRSVVPSARRQTPQEMQAIEPRLSPALAQTLAGTLAIGRASALGDFERAEAALNDLATYANVLRNTSMPLAEAAERANTTIQRRLDLAAKRP